MTKKQDYWRKQLDKQKESGLSVAAFCKEQNLLAWKFHYWRRKSNAAVEPGLPAQFIQVSEVPRSEDCGLDILCDDFRLRILRSDFDAHALRRLLHLTQNASH